jgi:hypothetical protein
MIVEKGCPLANRVLGGQRLPVSPSAFPSALPPSATGFRGQHAVARSL